MNDDSQKSQIDLNGSAGEVERDALRLMEELKDKRTTLRLHLAEGETQAGNGEFIKDFSLDRLIRNLDME